MRPAYTEKAPQGEDTSAAEQSKEHAATDSISRQAAIDALEREKSLVERPITETRWFDFGLGKAQDVLSELPSAQPEQRWIPVSERPKKDGRYQVTRLDYVTDTKFIDILWYEKNTWWDRQATGDYAVTAWMPLPEPYKEEE